MTDSTTSTILATCVGRMILKQYLRCEIKFILVMGKLRCLHNILNIITIHLKSILNDAKKDVIIYNNDIHTVINYWS